MSEQRIIRVLIADDHRMVRKGLAILIEGTDDLALVGEASNGREAVRLCTELRPDVVLMDLIMPEMDGVEAIRIIHQTCAHVQVVALTSYKDDTLVQSALQAGAVGYLLKDASVDDLIAAIRAAHDGKPTLSLEAMQALLQGKTQPPPLGDDLTAREREVLAALVEGLTNRQIAIQLGISPYTVNAHVSSILSKLNASSRTEAVALALQHNLLSK